MFLCFIIKRLRLGIINISIIINIHTPTILKYIFVLKVERKKERRYRRPELVNILLFSLYVY